MPRSSTIWWGSPRFRWGGFRTQGGVYPKFKSQNPPRHAAPAPRSGGGRPAPGGEGSNTPGVCRAGPRAWGPGERNLHRAKTRLLIFIYAMGGHGPFSVWKLQTQSCIGVTCAVCESRAFFSCLVNCPCPRCNPPHYKNK